jgi:hypothetical protein
MTFLAPSLLAIGAVLTAIPILIHFLNRRRHRTVEWAAMKYLLAAMRQNRRRLRFESLLLLIARCACLFILAMAISRPLGCSDNAFASIAARRVGLHVIVVDDSYSMAYEANRPDARTHFDQAKKLAKQVIGRLESGAQQVAVITASKPAKLVIKPTHDLDAAALAVDRLTQTYSATDIGGALRLASQIAESDSTVPTRTLHLFTDSTNSALKSDAQLPALAQALAQQYRAVVYSLGQANQWNQAIATLGSSESLVRVGFGADLVTSVAGYGGGETMLSWKLDGKVLPGSTGIRPDAKPEPITQSQASFDKAGPVVAEVSIAANDRLRIDDVRRQVIDVTGDLRVLIVEGKRGIGALEGSGAFLKLALSPPVDPTATNGAARYVTPVEISDLQLAGQPLGEFRSVILAGVGSISAETAKSLRGYVDAGGSVVLFMGEAVSGDQYNATLGAAGLLPGTLVARADAGSGQKAFSFDFDPSKPNQVLNAFHNIEKSGLDAAQVTTYWRVRPDAERNAQVVLRFRATVPDEPGDPAITLQQVGRGRVIFVATSADADWSTLVAKPAYVTLVHELLGSAVGGGERWMNLEAGESLELPTSLQLSATPVLRENDQKSTTLDRVDRGDGTTVWRSPPVARPGLYTLEAGPQHWPVAVNAPIEEADVRTLDAAGIRHALGDIDFELLGDSLPSADDAASGPSKSDWSWPILFAVLPLLFAESLMAWRFSGRGKGAA